MDDAWENFHSWSHWDAVRHYMYEDIYEVLKAYPFTPETKLYVEVGASTKQRNTYVVRMLDQLKDLGHDINFTTDMMTFEEVDVQVMPYQNSTVDILVADQVLEHTKRPWVAADEIFRVVRKGGMAIMTTPFLLPIHYCPLDCWRIAPQGYEVLFPDTKWKTLTLKTWGTKAGMKWAYDDEKVGGWTKDWVSVERGFKEIPNYATELADGEYPVVVWWIGERR